MILHVTTADAWQAALLAGFYESSTLGTQGFIHCCLPHQLTGVIERYYANTQNMIVLHIDESKLLSPVVYEPSPVIPELFPHVYGIKNQDAVQTIEQPVR